jgi:hypothetical protein
MIHNDRLHAMESIEWHSKGMARHAENVVYYVRQLLSQPEYETRAEDEMQRAVDALTDALAKAKQALKNYKQLPKDTKRVDHDAKEIPSA